MPTSSFSPVNPLQPRKRAIVVGASSGIGAALVRALSQNDYHVAALARREAMLAELCTNVNQTTGDNSRAIYYRHDVTNFDETPALFQKVIADLGGLDLLIYAAAIQETMTPNEYDFNKDRAMTRVNLLGAMSWLSLAAGRFERASAGHLVGISSLAGDRGRRLNPGYNAGKAALDTYLEALRNRLTRYGVCVTTIKPGFVETKLLEHAPKTMWVISPAEAADKIVRAIQRKKQVVYVPRRWRFVGLIIRHIPSFIFRKMNL
jgi:short-subunit dehydrogenase